MSEAQIDILVPSEHFLARYILLHKDLGIFNRHTHFDLPYRLSSILNHIPHHSIPKYLPGNFINYSLQSRWSFDSAIDQPFHSTELWLWNQLTSNVTLFLSSAFTNHPDGEFILGTSHTRLNQTGLISRAYVSGSWEHFEFIWGRTPLQWGPGRIRQLGVSGDIPSQDLIKLTFKQDKKYRLSYFLSQLDRQPVTGDEGVPVDYNRWLSGHRVELPLFGGRLLLGAGDYVLYTGPNRGVELNYFNPLSPFHTQTFENKVSGRDTAFVSDVGGDNQNVAIYGDFNWAVRDNLHLYGELFIDEFQIDAADRKRTDDALGILVGTAGGFQKDRLTWHYTLEMYRLSTWLYNHGGLATNWTYNKHQIGFREGADLQGFTARSEWWWDMDKMVSLQYTNFNQGEISTDTPWAPRSTKNSSFPFGVVEKLRTIEMSLFYFPLTWLQVTGGYKYSVIHNVDHIEGADNTVSELNVAIQFLL